MGKTEKGQKIQIIKEIQTRNSGMWVLKRLKGTQNLAKERALVVGLRRNKVEQSIREQRESEMRSFEKIVEWGTYLVKGSKQVQ